MRHSALAPSRSVDRDVSRKRSDRGFFIAWDMFSPVRLTIRHRELDEPVSATLENDGLPRSRITWNLTLDRLPWSIKKGDIMTPPAKSLWAWASDSDLDDVPSTVEERKKSPGTSNTQGCQSG